MLYFAYIIIILHSETVTENAGAAPIFLLRREGPEVAHSIRRRQLVDAAAIWG